ncbi:unnamed protein product [Amoebophrya sp. A25]|nr:unnamed protein product [Amoebophrya sp. A25]|eukprot:GSA25T00016667001.1
MAMREGSRSPSQRAPLVGAMGQGRAPLSNAKQRPRGDEVDEPSWLQKKHERHPAATTFCCIGTLLLASAGLITFNKFLIAGGRFSYPLALTAWHMFVCAIFSTVLYWRKPDWFTTMNYINRETAWAYAKFIVPMSLCFGSSVVLSNTAYYFASVPFLQMMKEGNIIIVYVISLIASVEQWSWRIVTILFVVASGAYLSLGGEAHFVWAGFFMQFGSQFFECTRLVVQSKVLSSAAGSSIKKIDALTFLLLVSPCCLFALVGALAYTWTPDVLTKFLESWPYMVGNGLVALLLNATTSLFLGCFSPLTFVVAGMMKDFLIVVVSVQLLGENITPMQALGFSIEVFGVACYSTIRACSDDFPADRWVVEVLYTKLATRVTNEMSAPTKGVMVVDPAKSSRLLSTSRTSAVSIASTTGSSRRESDASSLRDSSSDARIVEVLSSDLRKISSFEEDSNGVTTSSDQEREGSTLSSGDERLLRGTLSESSTASARGPVANV